MRRLLVAAAVVLVLLPASSASAGLGVGVGIYGGPTIPIVQDDNKTGFQWGLRAPVMGIPFVSIEPYFASSSLGDGEIDLDGEKYTRDGFDITAFGANAILGSPTSVGFHIYPYVGIGSHTLKRSGSPNQTEVGYNFGLGAALSPGFKISVHARGEFNMVVTGDTSRKFANVNVGLTYNLFSPVP